MIINRKIWGVLCLLTVPLLSEISLQENIYDAANEMVRFDEKMNRAIAEHNQEYLGEEKTFDEEMTIEAPSDINDFEETEDGYKLILHFENINKNQIKTEINNNILTITRTIRERKKIASTDISTIESSIISILIPNKANQEKMEKKYQNGTLKITFNKK